MSKADNVYPDLHAQRLRVTKSVPTKWAVTGPSNLYVPASGKRARLQWIYLAAPSTNTAMVVASVRLGSTLIYEAPLDAPGVFAHASVRDAINADDALTLTLSLSGQFVYVNIDVEDF